MGQATIGTGMNRDLRKFPTEIQKDKETLY